MQKYIKMAEKYALDHKFDEGLEYFLCALIVRGGSIISVGFNKKPTNTFVEHYADVARGKRDYCMSTHAELDAICKARAKVDLRGTKLYVTRIKPSGGMGMARPCEICMGALENYGIKRVYYSIENNEYGVLKVT
jgi:deoxycytidylate deaminase